METGNDSQQIVRQLIREHGNAIYNFIARMVTSRADAEELAQDTFVKAYHAWDSYDPDKSSVRTWLCLIAYRLSLNHLRRKRPSVVSIDEALPDDSVSDEALDAGLSTGLQRRIDTMNRAIGLLSPDEQTLLTLHYHEGLPLADIAFIMESRPMPLANRLYRIRKKLYRLIQQMENH